MVFLALPSAAAEDVEEWVEKQKKLEAYYVQQMIEITKIREHHTIPRKFPNKTPKDIQKDMDEYVEEFDDELKSGGSVKLENPQSSSSRTMDLYWFTPLVMNFIRKAVRSKAGEDASPLEGYSICFTNKHDDMPILIVMETVMTSEEEGDTASGDEKAGFEVTHLTPLAEQLSESITAANSVLREMHSMERREGRMRLTADNINARVRYFSYISVTVLLVVTYIQVTYLKRYFHKKKLL
jgi:hypothetical protein